MALAYECDICKRLFKPSTEDEIAFNELQIAYRYIKNGNIYRSITKTACPTCMNHIIKFINAHYDEKDKIEEVSE